MLSAWPLPRPRNWNARLRDAQAAEKLDAIRRSVNKGQPYRSENWVKRMAKRLGLESTLRWRGRPRKQPLGN